MSAVTHEDLKTILLFGIHLARIDTQFVPFEKKILARFADAMKLTEEERASLLEQNVSLGEGLKQLSGPEARTLLLHTLCAVSFSDGNTHPAEVEFINKVARKIGDAGALLPKEEWGAYEEQVFQAFEEIV